MGLYLIISIIVTLTITLVTKSHDPFSTQETTLRGWLGQHRLPHRPGADPPTTPSKVAWCPGLEPMPQGGAGHRWGRSKDRRCPLEAPAPGTPMRPWCWRLSVAHGRWTLLVTLCGRKKVRKKKKKHFSWALQLAVSFEFIPLFVHLDANAVCDVCFVM